MTDEAASCAAAVATANSIRPCTVPDSSALQPRLREAYFHDSYRMTVDDPHCLALGLFLRAASQTPRWVERPMGLRNRIVAVGPEEPGRAAWGGSREAAGGLPTRPARWHLHPDLGVGRRSETLNIDCRLQGTQVSEKDARFGSTAARRFRDQDARQPTLRPGCWTAAFLPLTVTARSRPLRLAALLSFISLRIPGVANGHAGRIPCRLALPEPPGSTSRLGDLRLLR